MKDKVKYEIQFSGLKNGEHSFEWPIEPTFFDGTSGGEILDSALKCEVDLNKNERMMKFHFRIFGKVKTICDHCGDELWFDIDSNEELIAKFSSETDLTGDEVIFLGNSEYKLDIAQFLIEFTWLAMPSKRVHPPGKCNPDVEQYFEVKDPNSETETEKDPRWKALDKLKK